MRSTCASTVISATCRRYVDLPAMLGPVMSAKLEHSACRTDWSSGHISIQAEGVTALLPSTAQVGVVGRELEARLRLLQ